MNLRPIPSPGSFLLGALFATALVGPWSAAPAGSSIDLTRIPVDPDVVARGLERANVSLAKVVSEAEQRLGGRALEARVDLDGDGARVHVSVFGKGSAHRLVLDPSGEVLVEEPIVRSFPGAPLAGDEQHSDTGLVWWDLVEGDGPAPSGPTAKVKVHYTGWLLDGTKFDSSVDRGEPITFPLNRVIPGWTEGVGSMKVGGKRKLVIPSQLGYGARDMGQIPPNSVLVFDVELISIEP
jgi:hypothetical protein